MFLLQSFSSTISPLPYPLINISFVISFFSFYLLQLIINFSRKDRPARPILTSSSSSSIDQNVFVCLCSFQEFKFYLSVKTKALHHKRLLFPWSRYHIGVVRLHVRVNVLLVCCLRGIHLLCQSRKYWSHSLGNAVKLLFKERGELPAE